MLVISYTLRPMISCDELGEKPCGDGYMQLSYTCCPDEAGGCPATARCELADNSEYGCYPLGKTCTGPGGATTDLNTRTSIIPGDTSTVTIPQGPTSTTEPTDEPTSTDDSEEPPSFSTTTYTATLPITTISSTLAPSKAANATATTHRPLAVTAGAATNGLSASSLLGGLLARVLSFVF
ncbi:GPI anchored serine-threonine rich protein [Tolypocladium paradoxum]|uniref:GPI anchored serine-threonine rich protein n=1 Tax=Tolypocladium paradoxum TaxID=94208 RepID=A0A2S4KXG2_9HYPO|nr:GPI anchored serine-threonine rich protein [Tolypocladium paradoxum]